MNQSLLTFEQTTVDADNLASAARTAAQVAKLKAKLAAKAQRAILKRQAELDKMSRRFARDTARKQRTPDEHAQCGIRWYCRSPRDRERGCYWTHCHACGQALIYTSDPNAKPQQCKGRKPELWPGKIAAAEPQRFSRIAVSWGSDILPTPHPPEGEPSGHRDIELARSRHG